MIELAVHVTSDWKMSNTIIYILVFTGFVITCVAVMAYRHLNRHDNKPTDDVAGSINDIVISTPVSPARNRVLSAFDPQRHHKLYAQISSPDPKEWQLIGSVSDDQIVTTDGKTRDVDDVVALLLVYDNGEILDHFGNWTPLPLGVHNMSYAEKKMIDVLDLQRLAAGNRNIQVTYSKSPTRPNDSNYYSTSLKNISAQRVRVLRFGGYVRDKKQWKLHNASNTFYSGEQFQSWYGMGHKNWIESGDVVIDPQNYGGRPVIWAYFCESEDGDQFVAGAELP
ncbi:hypothetical protein Pan258_03680 [Symmachiella dynata]|uniref:hypothetical protein n=1 Tax=Symmachiella dynata TaxID=2527995 RepID=UPI0011879ACB|nr:hypothetical protein [Symmachiella dynata]QDT46350.1 hypothetical protein Pan258_03680 [Symmachiella dynata]